MRAPRALEPTRAPRQQLCARTVDTARPPPRQGYNEKKCVKLTLRGRGDPQFASRSAKNVC